MRAKDQPQLSEYFGPVGEFFLGFLGLAFLLSLHAPFRRWARRAFLKCAGATRRYYLAANARAPGMYRWTQAFLMILREQRGLLLIVIAVVAFDYLSGAYDRAIYKFLIKPKIDALDYGSPSVQRLLWLHYNSTYVITSVGYTLFGWLAMMRARDIGFNRAARFSPLTSVLALFACVAGADLIARTLNPSLFFFARQYQAGDLYYIGGAFAVGFVILTIGALFISKRFEHRSAATAVAAIVGFVLLTHLNQWMYWLSRPIFAEPAWLYLALHMISRFAYTFLWDFVFIAFVIVLAAPGARSNR